MFVGEESYSGRRKEMGAEPVEFTRAVGALSSN